MQWYFGVEGDVNKKEEKVTSGGIACICHRWHIPNVDPALCPYTINDQDLVDAFCGFDENRWMKWDIWVIVTVWCLSSSIKAKTERSCCVGTHEVACYKQGINSFWWRVKLDCAHVEIVFVKFS